MVIREMEEERQRLWLRGIRTGAGVLWAQVGSISSGDPISLDDVSSAYLLASWHKESKGSRGPS